MLHQLLRRIDTVYYRNTFFLGTDLLYVVQTRAVERIRTFIHTMFEHEHGTKSNVTTTTIYWYTTISVNEQTHTLHTSRNNQIFHKSSFLQSFR